MVANLFGGSAKDSQYIVVIGCGRLGSLLASQLSAQGHSVVVIDRYEAAFENLSGEFSGFQITGDAAELATLRRAKADKASCLLAVTREDNVNLMVAQIGKVVFEIPSVLARVFDPAREVIYKEFGIETISPTHLSADVFLQKLETQFNQVAK
ncbi:MAG: TrkA family potassium uptake protein [Phormidesmis sp.]